MNDQKIVAVNLTDNPRRQHNSSTPSPKAKLALQIKIEDTELSIFNGADKYIIYAALEKLNYGRS
jgi:hypothetical protein